MRLQVLNKKGELQDVVVGYEDPAFYNLPPYTEHNFCIGATIGRYAGRISKGGFELDNQRFELPLVEGIHLHGGAEGFDKQLWTVLETKNNEHPYVIFEYKSPDGHCGYPGNVIVTAKYELTEDSLLITYEAISDKLTVLNLTNHAYFHLDDSGTVAGNELYINADSILQVDERLIPTGRFQKVTKSPYDYRRPIPLDFEGHYGLDTPFVLNGQGKAATLYSFNSGIKMEVTTNQPALVVFTPQIFPELGLRDEEDYAYFPAICFECQNFPDAPNHSNFPSAELRPGSKYRNQIRYRFSIK